MLIVRVYNNMECKIKMVLFTEKNIFFEFDYNLNRINSTSANMQKKKHSKLVHALNSTL